MLADAPKVHLIVFTPKILSEVEASIIFTNRVVNNLAVILEDIHAFVLKDSRGIVLEDSLAVMVLIVACCNRSHFRGKAEGGGRTGSGNVLLAAISTVNLVGTPTLEPVGWVFLVKLSVFLGCPANPYSPFVGRETAPSSPNYLSYSERKKIDNKS